MREAIVKYFFQGLTLILVLVIILNTCNRKETPVQIIKRDTVINNYYTVYKGDTTIIKPTVRETVKYTEKDTVFVDSSSVALVNEIKLLKKELYNTNKYIDTIKVDTIGTMILSEDVSNNLISQRKIKYNLKIPKSDTIVTNIIPTKIKNKWFIGGGVGGNKQQIVNDFNIGLGVLNKNDRLFELKTRVDLKGNIFGEFNTYWKIHF